MAKLTNLFKGMESGGPTDFRRLSSFTHDTKPFIGPVDEHANKMCEEVEELTKAELSYVFGVGSSQILQWELSSIVRILFGVLVKCLTEKRDKNSDDLTYTFLDCFTVEAKSRIMEDSENLGVFNFKTYTGEAYKIEGNGIDNCIGTLIKRKSDFPAGLTREGGPLKADEYLTEILKDYEDAEEIAAQAMVIDQKTRAILSMEYNQHLPIPLSTVLWSKVYIDNLIGALLVEAYTSIMKSIEDGNEIQTKFSINFYDVFRPTVLVTIVNENGEDKLHFDVVFSSDSTTRMNNKSDGSQQYETQM